VTDTSLTSREFALPGDDEPPARRYWSRGASGLLVVLIHLVFFVMLTFSIRLVDFGHRSALETILLLPTLDGRETTEPQMIQPRAITAAPPVIITSPITIPKPPLPEEQELHRPVTPGDVLKAVGEELSCGAGSFEHLTQPERERCLRQPWLARRGPAGTLVLAPANQAPRLAAPPAEFRISGADAQRRSIETAPTGCPVMLNIPCLNQFPRAND
jgi:hypothetical protein